MRYGDFKTPIQMVKPLQTKDTPEYQAAAHACQYAEARWRVKRRREIHCEAGDAEGSWSIEIGYAVGPEWLRYRRIIAKSWKDAERVIENHTQHYRGDVTVCGFSLPKVEE